MPRPALPAQPTPSLAATMLRPKLVKTKPASTPGWRYSAKCRRREGGARFQTFWNPEARAGRA